MEHKTRLVVVEATFRFIQEVDASDSADDIANQNNMNGHHEDGCRYCAMNVINSAESEPRLCSLRYVREASKDDVSNWITDGANAVH